MHYIKELGDRGLLDDLKQLDASDRELHTVPFVGKMQVERFKRVDLFGEQMEIDLSSGVMQDI